MDMIKKLIITTIILLKGTSSQIMESIKTSMPITDPKMYAVYPKLHKLDMSNQASFKFPHGKNLLAHESLSIYICNKCGVSSIYQQSLSQLPQLTAIELKNNRLQFVHQDAFANNTQLKKINFASNQLVTFNSEATIRHLAALHVIDLSNNIELDLNQVNLSAGQLMILNCSNCGTGYLDRYTLAGVQKLSLVNLGSNGLYMIEDDAFQILDRIKTLIIDGNHELNELHITSKTLKSLSVQKCSLRKMPNITALPALRTLNMQGNKIKHLDESEVVKHQNIKTLILDDNEIEKIPYDLFNLSRLRTLCIDRNLLQPNVHAQIAAKIYKNRNYRNQCLEHDDIFKQFEYFLPSGNGIAVYKKHAIHQTTNDGSTMDLSSRNIIFIEKDYTSDYPNVKELFLDNNQNFAFQEHTVFLQSEIIETLSMQRCSITKIYRNTFEKLPKLKNLYLQGNAIQALESSMLFVKNPALHCVNLAGNNLELISATIFDRHFSLDSLILDENRKLSNTEEGFLVSYSLRYLSCVGCGFAEIAFNTLKFLPKLQSLNLQKNPLKSCATLSKYLNRLKTLCLDGDFLDDASLNALGNKVARLTELETNCTGKKLSETYLQRFQKNMDEVPVEAAPGKIVSTFNHASMRMIDLSVSCLLLVCLYLCKICQDKG